MNIMNKPTTLGAIAVLFGAICMSQAGLAHGGGFGLAAADEADASRHTESEHDALPLLVSRGFEFDRATVRRMVLP